MVQHCINVHQQYVELPPTHNQVVHHKLGHLNINVDGITKLLSDLDPTKACGPDGIPNAVLKHCAKQISPSLSVIYQHSLDNGELPHDWLNANITSVFKKGDRHSPENYRPISLTSVPCKILEHVIYSHLMEHLQRNNILTNLNHGFRKGYSCESQLAITVNDLLKSNDNKKTN